MSIDTHLGLKHKTPRIINRMTDKMRYSANFSAPIRGKNKSRKALTYFITCAKNI